MATTKAKERMEAWFPALAKAGYSLTSTETIDYNCIAWAAGESHRRWDPAPGYYWPPVIERGDSIKTLIEVYRSLGYELCDPADGSVLAVEDGMDKIALYSVQGEWTHAARQLDSGKWSSKIGDMEDIEHNSPGDLAGPDYGVVSHYMKRTRTHETRA